MGQNVCVIHVLWECPAYSSCKEAFKAKVKELIGDSIEQLSDIDETVYVLVSELALALALALSLMYGR